MGIEYHEYLKSIAWQIIRRLALARAHFRCVICNTDQNLHVHHRTYERFGKENIEDLTVLCEGCHKLFHDKLAGPPPKQKPYSDALKMFNETKRLYLEEKEKNG